MIFNWSCLFQGKSFGDLSGRGQTISLPVVTDSWLLEMSRANRLDVGLVLQITAMYVRLHIIHMEVHLFFVFFLPRADTSSFFGRYIGRFVQLWPSKADANRSLRRFPQLGITGPTRNKAIHTLVNGHYCTMFWFFRGQKQQKTLDLVYGWVCGTLTNHQYNQLLTIGG